MYRNQKRGLLFGALMILFAGVLLGATAGGFMGYLFASHWGSPAAEAVVQPLSGDTLTLSELPPVTEAPATEAAPAPRVEQPSQPTPQAEAPALADEPIVAAVQNVQPATVRVMTNTGSGSGVIISEDGYIVTNNHVVEGARQFAVDYARGERVPAELVGTAPEFDLAVLKVEGAVPGVATWGDSSAVPLGEQVIAIGSALGEYQNTVTVGVLSGANRILGNIQGLLQTDAAINKGNSGGPLLNRQGEVIGINTMVVRGGYSEAEGLGFAIPSNVARGIARQLIETGQAERPLMGVELIALNTQSARELGLSVDEGAYIQSVSSNSPSEQAGIQVGDVILAVDGHAVTDRDTLQMLVLSHSPGDSVTMTVLRDGQEQQVELTLGSANRQG